MYDHIQDIDLQQCYAVCVTVKLYIIITSPYVQCKEIV